jgi:APA family basic amino acid/polyamine antiporter
MMGLPARAWERFGIWLTIGIVIYFLYGFRKSTLRQRKSPPTVTAE